MESGDLVYHGRQLEAPALAAERITADKHDNPDRCHIGRMKKPGCYSKKNHSFKENDKETTKHIKTTNKECRTCSSKKCPGHKSCSAYRYKCFDCPQKGHFRGTIYYKHSNMQQLTHYRVKMTQQIPHVHLMIAQALKVLQFKTISHDKT